MPDSVQVRCESCGHPKSEGCWDATNSGYPWGRVPTNPSDEADMFAAVAMLLEEGEEPDGKYMHYSPCDKKCRHHGPARFRDGDTEERCYKTLPNWIRADATVVAWEQVEASWRHVEAREPDGMTLCLRCYVKQTQDVVPCT